VSDPDVTPVGRARDPFGRPAVEHRRGRVRIAAGILLCAAAAGGIAWAIVSFGREQQALLGAAVAEGRIGGEPVRFASEAGPYTIFMRTPRFGNDARFEREVAATVCVVRLASERLLQVNGNRQGLSTVTDTARSVGVFDSAPGPAMAQCASRSRSRTIDRTFVIAAGKASVSTGSLPLGVGLVLGTAGGLLLASGLRGRRRSRNW
jgi:hypothetical protein